MRLSKFVATLVVFMLSGCECDEGLQRVCPLPVPCTVPEGLENTEENIVTDEVRLERFNKIGECGLGLTACDSNLELICVGYRHPQTEACDFLDNDCDGKIDEDFDEDEDGFTTCGGDCDDTYPQINPDALEVCNGIDDDCDGLIPPSETTDADGDGVAACNDCNDQDRYIAPGLEEVCDGKDNDCDDEIDEETPNEYDLCGPAAPIGQCRFGRVRCLDGESVCIDATYPSGEICDNVDNDCNGLKDDGLWRECSSICGVGFETCKSGIWKECTAPTPQLEVCDGIDNDCNGEIDEGCECIAGAFEVCAGGTIDPITFEVLNCGVGIKECDVNGEWGPCIFVMPTPEQCNNYDDDCDGLIDGMSTDCTDGEYAVVGECRSGTTVCTEGIWGECEGAVGPQEEVCNELDDDCDGEVDEDLNAYDKVDMVFAIDGSGSMCQAIDALVQGIGEYVSDFQETEHRFALVIFPGNFASSGPAIPWVLATDLTDVASFVAMLSSVVCDYGGVEPSRDAVYDIADPANPIGLSWREDAYPYIVVMTDEHPQSVRNIGEVGLGYATNNCQVGSCEAGDQFEIYVFTAPQYFYQWDEPTFFEPERLISLFPVDADEYANKLRDVFTNVCL